MDRGAIKVCHVTGSFVFPAFSGLFLRVYMHFTKDWSCTKDENTKRRLSIGRQLLTKHQFVSLFFGFVVFLVWFCSLVIEWFHVSNPSSVWQLAGATTLITRCAVWLLAPFALKHLQTFHRFCLIYTPVPLAFLLIFYDSFSWSISLLSLHGHLERRVVLPKRHFANLLGLNTMLTLTRRDLSKEYWNLAYGFYRHTFLSVNSTVTRNWERKWPSHQSFLLTHRYFISLLSILAASDFYTERETERDTDTDRQTANEPALSVDQ